jgi:hypothetical protein
MKQQIAVSFIIITLGCGILSCGNPWIQEEYERVAGIGDTLTYTIDSILDLPKLQGHPNGTFIITAVDDIELNAPLTEFSGTIQGAGAGRILVNGMFCLSAKDATFRDAVFVQNGSSPRGQALLGVVAGSAVKTQFINVQASGSSLSALKTGDEDVIIGGIAGSIDADSVVERCSSLVNTINVTSAQTVIAGGIVGKNEGTIKYSYGHSSINVNASTTVKAAGLAGTNTGTITDSYYASSGGINGNSLDPATYPPLLAGFVAENSSTLKNSYTHAPGTNEQVGTGSGVTPDNCMYGGNNHSFGNPASYSSFISQNNSSQWVLTSDMGSSGTFARLANNFDTSRDW